MVAAGDQPFEQENRTLEFGLSMCHTRDRLSILWERGRVSHKHRLLLWRH